MQGAVQKLESMVTSAASLQSPALRLRHWQRLAKQLSLELPTAAAERATAAAGLPTGAEITLGALVAANLGEHAAFVAALCAAAAQELGVERGIEVCSLLGQPQKANLKSPFQNSVSSAWVALLLSFPERSLALLGRPQNSIQKCCKCLGVTAVNITREKPWLQHQRVETA